MSESIPVLVAGAGCAGLVAALTLAQSGVPVRIIDKEPKFRPGSRGFGVQPRTYELFELLGVLDDVKRHATPIPKLAAHKPGSLEVVKEWDLYAPRRPWPDRPNGNGTCLQQSVLEKILRDRLAKYGVRIELCKSIVGIEQTKDSVAATIAGHENGQSTEQREIVLCQYVVGADGAKGSTRKLLGLTFAGETRDADGQVWGDVEIEDLPNNYWHVWGNPGQWSIIIRPITPGQGQMFSFGITGQNFDPVNLATPEAAAGFIREQTQIDLKFGKWDWLSYFKPNIRMVSKFHEGRVYVIGDASHVHSPSGGQGMNTSVQDGCNIGWKLALVLKNLASPALLETLHEERLPVITQMLAATSQLYTHMVSRLKPKENTDATKETTPPVDDEKKSGWYRWRNDALELYGVNYRYSSIVLEERDKIPLDMEDALAHAYAGYEAVPGIRAGDRAPDAPGLLLNGQETTLFKQLTVVKHTVLVYAATGYEEKAVHETTSLAKGYHNLAQTFLISHQELPTQAHVSVLHDRDGYAHANYFVEENSVDLVIVRPDGFIGAIVQDIEGVHRYFSKILAIA